MKTILFTVIACALSQVAHAGTLEQISHASCKSARGSYLELDRKENVLEARFADLPVLTNLADGDRVPLEVQSEDSYVILGTLASDPSTGFWGNVSLVAKKGQDLKQTESLHAVFSDWNGGRKTEVLNCALRF